MSLKHTFLVETIYAKTQVVEYECKRKSSSINQLHIKLGIVPYNTNRYRWTSFIPTTFR